MDNFFYNLNDKLNAIRDLPSTTPGQLNERDMSRAAKGYEKYGKEGMEALAKAGRDGKALDPVRKKYDKYDESVEEGMGDMARKVGGAVKKVAGKALDTLGHGSDEDLRKKMQQDMGATGAQVHGKKSMAIPNPKQVKEANAPINFDKVLDAIAALYGDDMWENDAMQDLANDLEQAGPTDQELDFIIAKGKLPKRLAGIQFSAGDDVRFGEGASPMSAKQKSFAALAEPKDKITFADKIAGAKKEVDEMLGDVAAEAMKQALGGGRGRNAEVDEEVKSRKIAGSRYGGAKQVDKPEHDDAPRAKAKAGRPEGDQLKPDWSAFGGNKPVKLGKHKGAVTKHEIGDKTPAKGQAADAAFKASEKAAKGAKKVKEGAGPDDIAVLERLMDEAFADGNNALGNALQGVLEKMDSGEKQVDEKAVSKKQQRFMGMVHAAQKGEKAPSKEVAKVAKSMGKKDATDFAATKHKGLPEKKKPEGKKKEVDETTSSGSVATSSAPAKGKGGMSFGQGIYDSFNRDVEAMIAEGMTINMSMNSDGQAGPAKSLTVTATDEDAEQLAQMLSNAGMGAAPAGQPEMHNSDDSCGSCGMSKCGCGDIEEALDENNPDWPTEPTGQEDNINYYDTDGLNGRKTTGQTTVPVVASQGDRQMAYEDEELARMMEMAGMSAADGEQGMAEGSGYDGSKPLDLSTNPSVNDVFKRALYIYDYEGYGNDMDYSEDDAIEQYVARKFGQDVLDQLTTAKNQQYFGRADGKGPGGGGRTSNLGTSSAPGGDFRTTKAGKMHSQDAKMMKAKVADRLGRHPEPNLPEQSYAESEQAAIKRMMEMAGIAEVKKVEEDDVEEGNKFTGNLAKARAAGKKEADLDGDGDMEKVRESMSTVDTMEQNLMRQFSNFKI